MGVSVVGETRGERGEAGPATPGRDEAVIERVDDVSVAAELVAVGLVVAGEPSGADTSMKSNPMCSPSSRNWSSTVRRAPSLCWFASSNCIPAFSAEFSPAIFRNRLFCKSPLA